MKLKQGQSNYYLSVQGDYYQLVCVKFCTLSKIPLDLELQIKVLLPIKVSCDWLVMLNWDVAGLCPKHRYSIYDNDLFSALIASYHDI